MLHELTIDMITCKQVTSAATEILDEPSTLWRRILFRLHLTICKSCRQYFKQFQVVVGAAQRMPKPDEPSDEEIEAIVKRLKSS